MQGIMAISCTTGTADQSGLVIRLNNASFVMTTGEVVYSAPWIFLHPQNTSGIAFWMLNDLFGISGTSVSAYLEVVFDCELSTVTGTITRSDTSTVADVLISPQRLSFSPGQTELPFEVAFQSVNSDGLKIERPSWVEAQRSLGLMTGKG